MAELLGGDRRDDASMYAQYYAENPNTEIGKLANIISKAKQGGKYPIWDFTLVQKIAETISLLETLVPEIDADAEITLELDPWLEKDFVVILKSSTDEEWTVFQDNISIIRKIMENVDEFSITPLLDGSFQVTLVYKNVRKRN